MPICMKNMINEKYMISFIQSCIRKNLHEFSLTLFNYDSIIVFIVYTDGMDNYIRAEIDDIVICYETIDRFCEVFLDSLSDIYVCSKCQILYHDKEDTTEDMCNLCLLDSIINWNNVVRTVHDEWVCPICLSCDVNDTVEQLLCCSGKQFMHTGCLYKLLNRKCPMCRNDLKIKQVKSLFF